jgi:hypothetical protein
MGLLALGILLGLHYRVCTVLFWLAFTYQFLLDKALYQNHYYLISLISFLLIFLPAHRSASLDVWLRPQLRWETVPAWTLWLLRFQIGVPYFYGGIAKLNPDWLRCEPMRQGMAEPHRVGIPLIGQFFTQEWMVVLFSYGGLLLDLCIVPLLLWKRTRLAAFCFALMFHMLNATMFNIGIFPWFMILATLVFFSPDWPGRLVRNVARVFPELQRFVLSMQFGNLPADGNATIKPPAIPRLRRRAIVGLLAAYAAVQLIVPLRHFAYPGDASWTEEGHLFAWHMMLRGKRAAVSFIATYPETGQSGPININRYLTERQAIKIGKDPRMIHQFCRYLAAEAAKAGFEGVQIRAIVLVSLNGRKPQLLIDPTVDLAAQPPTWDRLPFIMPLTEPLRRPAWNVPPAEWPKYVLVSQRSDTIALTESE